MIASFGNKIRFIKMHAIGNDFVIIDCIHNNYSHEELAQHVKNLADRHFGIGADQVLFITKSSICQYKMVIYNQDGSSAEMCGNGLRCIAQHLMSQDKKHAIEIEVNNTIYFNRLVENNMITSELPAPATCKDMGEHVFVDVGNPHAIFFNKDDPSGIDASIFEQNNVSLLKILDKNTISVRVFEKGVGETNACGSAACASVYAAHTKNFVDLPAKVAFKHGFLLINILNKSTMAMTGPTQKVFEGEYYL